MHALLASRNQELYRLTIETVEDIQNQVREADIEAITAGPVDFWVTPILRGTRPLLNRPATRLLLGASRFTAREVPLLRGSVVVTSHDSQGRLAGLSHDQISWLADFRYDLRWRTEVVVEWRLRRAERADRRYRRARTNEQNNLRADWGWTRL